MKAEKTDIKEKKSSSKELTHLLEEKDKQVQEYINNLKRIQAEFENYIKRTEKNLQDNEKYSSHKLLLKLLNIADDFDRAVHNLENSETKENSRLDSEFASGIKLIHKNFHKILQEENVKEIKSIGEKFNPHYHEVIQKVKSDKENGIILEEIQKGYLFHDKVLRISKVIIAENSNSQGGN